VYATVQVEFTYENTSKKSVTEEFYATNLHPEVDYDISMCDTDAIELVISFYNDSSHVHYLTFTFKAEKDNKYQLKKITVDLDLTDEKLFPGYNQTENATVTGTTRDDDVFESSANRSYRCNSTRKFTLKQDPSDAGKKLVMKLSDFRAQAFHFKNEKTGAFDRSSRCSLDQKTSKIVPIAVGAALAGLVVVVLIAYLIGRFRSRKQNSYEALS
jgi:lysosomal-associated membrane protein 1/2